MSVHIYTSRSVHEVHIIFTFPTVRSIHPHETTSRALAHFHRPLADGRNELDDEHPSLKSRTEPDQWRSKFVTVSSYETIAL